MRRLAILLCWIASVIAQEEYEYDPYLDFKPPFARSLPVQIMLTGVVLTLVAVLFIHLMFTAQYHWPLAPVNYVLQLSGVTTLLISLIATIHVVLSAASAESEKWPYMLNYIAVNIPPLEFEQDSPQWTIAEKATWLVMNASTSGLIQITHIQFLTLLYPSRLEARLIFFLLGPLAIVAAVMQLLPISSSAHVADIAGAVRNVCNATLSLLFTAALFIWGLLVNRNRAWRTDGGTAVFGVAALTLALVSTALNFLYVHREQEYVWLPSLMWAVVLWQSFLGWWWWVGAGSGGGYADGEEGEEKMRKEDKKKSRRQQRNQQETKVHRVWKGVAGAFTPGASTSSRDPDGRALSQSTGREDEVGDARQRRRQRRRASSHSQSPTRTHPSHGDTTTHMGSVTNPTSPSSGTQSRRRARTETRSSPTPSDESVSSDESYNTLPRALPAFVHRWYASLRHEHLMAARQQAAERVERLREISGDARVGEGGAPTSGAAWGFGWIANGSKMDRCRSLDRHRSKRRERSTSISAHGEETEGEYELEEYPTRRNQPFSDEERCGSAEGSELERRRKSKGKRKQREASPSGGREIGMDSERSPPEVPAKSRSSVWWWGPLGRWRLQDSTVYR